MKKIQIGTDSIATTTLPIGFQGENDYTQIIIYWSQIYSKYPNAVASLAIKSPHGELYPKQITQTGNMVVWDISASDCATPGKGQYQLTFTNGTQVIKTYIGSFTVNESIIANGEEPDPIEDWLTEASEALSTFEENIEEIDKITTATAGDVGKALSPKTVTDGKVAEWEYIDPLDETLVQNLVDEWFDEHPSVAQIDDSSTANNKVWSAQKVNDLKSAISALDEITIQAQHYIPQSVTTTTGKAYNTKTDTLESLGGNFVCAEFQVTAGEQLKISGWGIADNYRPRFWSGSAIISTPSITGDDNGYFYDDVVDVPNGATRLLINGRIGGIVISKYGTNSATNQYTSEVISSARNNVVTFDTVVPQAFDLNSGQYVNTSTGEASSLYGFAYADFSVTEGDILLISGYGNTSSNAPAFWSESAIVKATGIVGDEENRFTDIRVVVPNGATRLLINGRPSLNINIAIKKVVNNDKSRQFFEEYDIAVEELSMAKFNIKNLERRALNAEKANDFAWGAFDHPYFVFIHDDTNSFLPDAYSAFHAKGKPLSCATIVSKLENEYSEQTAKEWLDLVVADGGEILTHWDYDLLSTSTDEEWYQHFVLPKRILEKNGFDVRGAILANASHAYTAKGQSYCRKYYDYADKVGTTTQYRLGRTLMLNFADLSAFRSQIDIDLQTNGLYAYGFHGLRQDESWITEQNLKDIIDYIVGNGGIITTYASVFDSVGSTVLEQRISALE